MMRTVGSPGRRRRTRPQRRRRLWLAPLLAAVLFVALLGAAVVRAETTTLPYLREHRVLPKTVTLPGGRPSLAWPSEGEGAVAVEGLGRLGSISGGRPVPIASVTKMMTAYLTLRKFPLEPGAEGFRVRITGAEAAEQQARAASGQSTLPVLAGETLTERQLLEALLIPSANNIAALLAVHVGGGIGAFLAKMNRTARELGMSRTTYTDPSGLAASTVSTPIDQLKLARVDLENPTFAQIVAMPAVSLPVVGRVANLNYLIGHRGYVGIKTGSDEAAGGCLVFARRMSAGGRAFTVIGAVFGQRRGEPIHAAVAAADRLASSVVATVKERVAIPAGTKVMTLENAEGRTVAVNTSRALSAVGWPGLRIPVQVSFGARRRTTARAERWGVVTLRGTPVARTPAVAAAPLSEPSPPVGGA
ncbi:MAG: D-alanyl-D-alanine carboxypeptidase [Actinobacteria bacterium]|nr:D-alanyl-D-alanine carboxypeptidase [Actinomycetota bacterium]